MSEQAWAAILSVVALSFVPAVLTAWFLWARRRDIRALRNGFIAMFLFYSLSSLVVSVVPAFELGRTVVAVVWSVFGALLLIGVLALPALLVANGLRMARREGRSLGNLLSLIAGVGIFAAPLISVGLVALNQPWSVAIAAVLVVAVAWFGFVFLGFLVHTVLYARRVRGATGNAVIVLGSQLVRDRVPPLLAGRLAAGVLAAERSRTALGREVPLVPSGGQGADEVRPEGVGMAQWLIEQGVDPGAVIVEDAARTTEENPTLSVALPRERGRAGPSLAAPSHHHAPRAAPPARDLGIDAQVVGGRTARYFLPSAYLREFVAVLRARPSTIVVGALLSLPLAIVAFRIAMIQN